MKYGRTSRTLKMANDSFLQIVDVVIKFSGAIVAWFLVILGWGVVSEMNSIRERKKNLEERIESIRKSLVEIEDLSTKHHTESYDEVRAMNISRKIKIVGLECSHLERIGMIKSEWRMKHNEVRRAVTMKNFAMEDHDKKDRKDEIFMSIATSFDSFHVFLINGIENSLRDSERMRNTLFRIVRKF